MRHSSSQCPHGDCWSGTDPLCLLCANLIPGIAAGGPAEGHCSSVIVRPVWARAPRALLVKRQPGGAGALKSAKERGILLELAT